MNFIELFSLCWVFRSLCLNQFSLVQHWFSLSWRWLRRFQKGVDLSTATSTNSLVLPIWMYCFSFIKRIRCFSSLRGRVDIDFLWWKWGARFHRFSSVLTKVLYDAIDRFSRMEMVVGYEMVPAQSGFPPDFLGFLPNLFDFFLQFVCIFSYFSISFWFF